MGIQEAGVYVAVAAALIYLIVRGRRAFYKKECNKGCGCAADLAKKNS